MPHALNERIRCISAVTAMRLMHKVDLHKPGLEDNVLAFALLNYKLCVLPK